jgi:hypothetical protein
VAKSSESQPDPHWYEEDADAGGGWSAGSIVEHGLERGEGA